MARTANTEYCNIPGLLAAADLTTKQFYCVMLDASGTVNVATQTYGMLGILLNKPNTGQACQIATTGSIAPALAGNAIAAGDVVMADVNDGMVIKATNGNVVCGMALEAATVDGDIIDIWMVGPYECSDVSKHGIANS